MNRIQVVLFDDKIDGVCVQARHGKDSGSLSMFYNR
jgi:hypothetical protein